MPPRRPASPASPLPTARDLALPRSARDLYTRLTAEPVGAWPALLASCAEHVERFEAALTTNEFLPVVEARQLGAALPRLYERARAHADPVLAGRLAWIATQVMRDELERVLAYPHIVERMDYYQVSAAQVLAAFDAQARLVEVAPKVAYVCKDADDQKFIDLAAAHRAILLSKDKAVICMRKRLANLGADVATEVALALANEAAASVLA